MNVVTKATQIGDFITIDQASKVKGSTNHTTYQWIKRNDVPRVKVGNTYLVRLTDLAAYQPR